ncbi:MAG: ribosome biogenesis GTP-binding protein YihA/YsxC [Saprospiraceae bacterium]|nr:ribosome biogenesis GTP-binding protein YihA/YsxC [Saprospiraceae bacterium]
MSHNVKFIGSFPSVRQCPDLKKPEYAFIGRSNVGKSSWINAMMERRQIAKVSATPGKTQTINLFDVDGRWTIADLPGYGYAKVSKSSRKQWLKMIRDYLLSREDLMVTFILIDLRIPPQEIDLDFIDQLGAQEIPFVILFTKTDKVKDRKINEHRGDFEKALSETWSELPKMFITSSKTGQGRDEVLSYIADLNSIWYNQRS